MKSRFEFSAEYDLESLQAVIDALAKAGWLIGSSVLRIGPCYITFSELGLRRMKQLSQTFMNTFPDFLKAKDVSQLKPGSIQFGAADLRFVLANLRAAGRELHASFSTAQVAVFVSIILNIAKENMPPGPQNPPDNPPRA